ncbi:MAG: tRNA-guanine transglycosylase, partial [Parcubacteria group bacterium]|nr:tRNA-guanine transglycosylase [Parcubacteria group bacterium]
TSGQKIYGIVQGGRFEDLRKESAKFIGSLGFDGLAIGGSFGTSFGSPRLKTFQELDWSVPILPENKPRHLLGIGLVGDLFMGVEKGIDTFDCVVPTREGRHGSVYTAKGRIDIKKGIYREDKSVIDERCGCEVCAVKKISKQELGEMFRSKNPEAGRLVSFHNVYFFNNLMGEIRQAIAEDKFEELKRQYVSL